MNKLDPASLFTRIAREIPSDLHSHLFITGSLAGAYHFQARLDGRAVNTKDADVVVHPAGDGVSAQQIAQRLLDVGWERTEKCYPKPQPEPLHELRAIRLYPPDSHEFFVVFLNVPPPSQECSKNWVPVRLADGWYGLPSFRFLGLVGQRRLTSEVGLEYASPEMMALSNLLSHPMVGEERMESAGPMQGLLRSAKDLGRVLALAWLAGRDATEEWPSSWREALTALFPNSWRDLAKGAGSGLRELLHDQVALDEAALTTEIGLLNGKGVTAEGLSAVGERLLVDAIEPLAEAASK